MPERVGFDLDGCEGDEESSYQTLCCIEIGFFSATLTLFAAICDFGGWSSVNSRTSWRANSKGEGRLVMEPAIAVADEPGFEVCP